MPYTPPLGNEIHLDFTDPLLTLDFNFLSSGYSPPAGSTLDFNFISPLLTLDLEFAPEELEPISKELLLSLGIRFHGQVYKYWICQMSHGTQQVRRYSIPPDPKTIPQLELRSKWAACVNAWHNLSTSDKLMWRRVGVRKKYPITSLNAYMSACMKDKI